MPTAADVTSLKESYSRIVALIADITANPKPSYIIDGQNVQWSAYLTNLRQSLVELRKEIEAATKETSGPVEFASYGYTTAPAD